MSITAHISRRQLQLCLLLGDAVLFTLAMWLVNTIRFQRFTPVETLFYDLKYWIILGIVYFSQYLYDLYEPRDSRGAIASRLKIGLSFVTSAVLVFSYLYIAGSPTRDLFGRGVFLGSLTIYIGLTYIFRAFLHRQIAKQAQRNRWLLLSSESNAKNFIADFHRSPTVGSIEWVDTSETVVTQEKIKNAIHQEWTGVIVEGAAATHLMEILMAAKLKGLRLYSMPDFYEMQWGRLPVTAIDDLWFAFTEGFSLVHSPVRLRLKRALDILVASTLLILTLPLAFFTWLLIRVTSRGPAIYRQARVGLKGKVFTIYKFRSMHVNSEQEGAQWAKENDQRSTWIGKYLRKFRIDEIPQLVNILRGDMSFIGPRPERPEFTESLAQQIPFYELRHLVKPGLTGWAQVMYPYGANVDDAKNKLEYELFYIKNHSIGLDIKILVKTFSVVLFGAGR